MKRLRAAVIAATVLLVCAAAAHAAPPALRAAHAPFAQKAFWERFFGSKAPPMPAASEYYIHDDKTFEQNTSSVHMRPYNSPSLEFDVRLPNHWTAEDLTIGQPGLSTGMEGDQKMVGSMVKLTSEMISVYRIVTYVMAQPLKQDLSAENWLKGYIFANGYALQGDVVADGPYKASVFFNSVSDQTNYFTYMTVHITGGYVFITHADVPLQIKAFATYIQKKLVDSLQVSYPRDQYVEPTKNYALVDAVRFSYPISWQAVNPDFKDMTHLSVQLQSKNPDDGSVKGFIRILAVKRLPGTSLSKEIGGLKRHLSDYMKLNVNSMISSGKPYMKYHARFIFAREEVYKASYQKEGILDPELRFVVFGDKDWYIFAYMLSPREGENLADWAHNLRTFEIVQETLH